MEHGLLSLKWNNHKTSFFEILKILREKSNYTDATLAVDGKFYDVHKLVMSTCSEYFSDIFKRTSCKSPVIVLKDVRSHDIEALLDYMYLGEVNVNQNDLASLLKTAECLRIKGLAVPDENPTKLCKNSTSSHDDTHQDIPPPKRRRYDSNTIPSSLQKKDTSLANSAQISSISSHSTSNTTHTKQDKSPVVKVEMLDTEENKERFRRENSYKGDVSSDPGPSRDYGSDIPETDHEPENYSNTSYSEPSKQQINHSIFNTFNNEQDEPIVVKVEMDNAEDQEERFRGEYDYEEGASNDPDLVWDYEPDHFKADQELMNYGNNTFHGHSVQQSVMDGAVGMNSYEQNPDTRTNPSILKLIRLYRDLPCLWQIKSLAYRDRNERRYAYTKIQEAFPNVSLTAIKKKINSIRTQYRRELKICLLSKKSGAGADQIYKPKLWFFEHINFLSEVAMLREPTTFLEKSQIENAINGNSKTEKQLLHRT